MSRYREAPFDFDCPYQKRCPHLEGLSTKWTFRRYQEAFRLEEKYWRMRDEYEARLDRQLADIRELEQENAELKAQLKALHQRQFNCGQLGDVAEIRTFLCQPGIRSLMFNIRDPRLGLTSLIFNIGSCCAPISLPIDDFFVDDEMVN